MKLPIISTATILLMSFITANSAIAQSSVRIICLRSQNVINCPGYGSFNYRSNKNNSNFNRRELDQAINNIYQQYLGRNADAAGLQYFRNSIINGGSIENVRNAIANSSEARNRGGNANYNRRELDQAINNIYQQYLGRNADPAGLVAYRNSIINGGSIEDVRNAIANSSEARNRNGNNSSNNTQGIDRAINNIYQQYLGRNADPAGLVAYRNSIINGGSIEDVRNTIANSPEARSRNGNSTFNRKDNKKDKDDRNEVSNRSEGRNRNGNSDFDRKDNKKEK